MRRFIRASSIRLTGVHPRYRDSFDFSKASSIFLGINFPRLDWIIRWAANHLFQLDRRALVCPVPDHPQYAAIVMAQKMLFQMKECVQYDFMDFLLSAFEYYDSMHMGTEYCSTTSSFNRKHVRTINTRPHTHLSHGAAMFFSRSAFFSCAWLYFILPGCFLFGSNT